MSSSSALFGDSGREELGRLASSGAQLPRNRSGLLITPRGVDNARLVEEVVEQAPHVCFGNVPLPKFPKVGAAPVPGEVRDQQETIHLTSGIQGTVFASNDEDMNTHRELAQSCHYNWLYYPLRL